MDPQRLIDDITDLVCQRLASPQAASAGSLDLAAAVAAAMSSIQGGAHAAPGSSAMSGPGSSGTGRALVVLGEGERGLQSLPALATSLTQAGLSLELYDSQRFPAQPLLGGIPQAAQARVRCCATAACWAEAVKGARLLVVPNLSLNALSGVATLAALEASAGAVIASLVEGIPVFVGADDIHFLTLNAAHLSKPFQDILRGHLNTVGGLGVQIVEAGALASAVATALATPRPAGGQGRGRSVLTADDVHSMLRTRPHAIEVASGTIVTPLARDVAEAAGVPIVVR